MQSLSLVIAFQRNDVFFFTNVHINERVYLSTRGKLRKRYYTRKEVTLAVPHQKNIKVGRSALSVGNVNKSGEIMCIQTDGEVKTSWKR